MHIAGTPEGNGRPGIGGYIAAAAAAILRSNPDEFINDGKAEGSAPANDVGGGGNPEGSSGGPGSATEGIEFTDLVLSGTGAFAAFAEDVDSVLCLRSIAFGAHVELEELEFDSEDFLFSFGGGL